MTLTEIIRSTDLSSVERIDRLFDLFVSRRTVINGMINEIVCSQIKDTSLKKYFLDKSKEVKALITYLPPKKKKEKGSSSVKNKNVIIDRGGLAADGPLGKIRDQKLREMSYLSTEDKYEYGLSDW